MMIYSTQIMPPKVCGVYKLHWNNNDYYYFGSALDIRKRFLSHSCLFNNKAHQNKKLQNIFNKYGNPLLTIMCVVPKAEIRSVEQFYLDVFRGRKYCCNIAHVAKGGSGFYTEESKKKISNALSGKPRPYASLLHKGRIASEETRKKISTALTGKKRSDEVRKNLSEKLKGRKQNKEWVEKRIRRGSASPHAKRIIDISTGIVYGSYVDAANVLGISVFVLKNQLSNKYNSITNFRKIDGNGSIITKERLHDGRSSWIKDNETGRIYYTITDLAKELGVERTGLNWKINKGKLPRYSKVSNTRITRHAKQKMVTP